MHGKVQFWREGGAQVKSVQKERVQFASVTDYIIKGGSR